jgi:hypothetical protein
MTSESDLRIDPNSLMILATLNAVRAFGDHTKPLSNPDFVRACRFAAAKFEELAKQNEPKATP